MLEVLLVRRTGNDFPGGIDEFSVIRPDDKFSREVCLLLEQKSLNRIDVLVKLFGGCFHFYKEIKKLWPPKREVYLNL